MTDAPSIRELLGLYLEESTRVDAAASEAVSAYTAVEAAEAALTSAREVLTSHVGSLASALGDLRAVVELSREAGLADPDPLHLLGPAPSPAPSVVVAPAPPGAPEPEDKPPLMGRGAGRPYYRRRPPGESQRLAYLALTPEPRQIHVIEAAAGPPLPGSGGKAIQAALPVLASLGLAVRTTGGPHGGPPTFYALADSAHLPVTRQDLVRWEGLANKGQIDFARNEIEARRLGVTSPTPSKPKRQPSTPAVDPIAPQAPFVPDPPVASLLDFDQRRRRRSER